MVVKSSEGNPFLVQLLLRFHFQATTAYFFPTIKTGEQNRSTFQFPLKHGCWRESGYWSHSTPMLRFWLLIFSSSGTSHRQLKWRPSMLLRRMWKRERKCVGTWIIPCGPIWGFRWNDEATWSNNFVKCTWHLNTFKGLQEDHCGGCLGFSSASVLSVLLFVLSSFFLIFVFSALKIAYAFGEGPWPCPLVAWLRLRRTEWAPKGARVGRWWTVGRGGATNIRWVGKVRLTRNVMKMTILSTSAAIILKWNVNYAFSEEIHSLS